MLIHRLKILLLFAPIALLGSCTRDTVCRRDMDVTMQVSLQADSLNAKGHAVKYTTWDSVTVEVVGKLDTLVNNRKNLSKLSLPLRPDTTLSVFLMTFHQQTDTLFVEHTPRQYFVSLACGCAIYHTITAAWSTDYRVDSVQIINANVENTLQDNLRIHLHE